MENSMNINLIDIIVIVILALAALRGLWNGFLIEIGGIAGVLVGLFLAGRYYHQFGATLSGFSDFGGWTPELAFGLLFLGGAIIVHIVVTLLRRLVKKPVFGSLDSIAGFVAGALKGALVCSVVMVLLNWVLPDVIRDSRLKEYLLPFFDWLISLLPW